MKRYVSRESLEKFIADVLVALDVDPWQIECVSDSLASTSLRGVDSHGVRLLMSYVQSLRGGRTKRQCTVTMTKPFATMCVIDGDNGMGAAAGYYAIDRCTEIAGELGMAMAVVQNSTHPGCMACFTLRAAKRGFLALAFTNTGPILAAHGGKRAYFGTNPISFAAPRQEGDPLCLDMATSVIPWNKVEQARHGSGGALPPGTCADKDGVETTVADQVKTLLPVGGYKGHGLAAMVEVMCCSLTGMAFGWHTKHMYGEHVDMAEKRCLGQCYMVMRCDPAVTATLFNNSVQTMTDEVRQETPLPGVEQVMMPGDPEIITARHRTEHGIPLNDVEWDDFTKLAKEVNVAMPELLK